jgi:hypothetical protein
VSKFLGKFRKDKDYKDDYVNSRSNSSERNRKSLQSEVRKQKMHWDQENFQEDEHEFVRMKNKRY